MHAGSKYAGSKYVGCKYVCGSRLAVREFCRGGVCSHQIEVNTDEISPCCACRTKVAVPGDTSYLWLKNIRETEENCKDCLIIDEFRNSHL